MVKVAILGYGTIGSGVYEILDKKKEFIKNKVGQEVCVKYILDLREFPGTPVEKLVVHDLNTILEDDEVSIVVEAMGGEHPAYDFIKAALLAGKSAATSNKAVVAAFGSELLQIAKENKVNFQFEASVGGGIPIIRPMYSCLTAGEVSEITGILNGTTNFMLTKMHTEKRTYEDVLKEAQALGYAERDPSADVDGFDTCRKIAILASIAMGQFVDYKDIPTRGIRSITDKDMALAEALGYSIKLFGTCKKDATGVTARVMPVLVDKTHPLYTVCDVFNGILVRGDVTGDLMFYGSGAGKLPTASAVVADIVEIAKNNGRTIMAGWSAQKLTLADCKNSISRFFIRLDHKATKEELLAFGSDSFACAEDVCGCAVITKPMSEAELGKICENVDGVCQTIAIAE